MSPTSGRSPATSPPATRTGSWLERKADTRFGSRWLGVAALLFAAVALTGSDIADARMRHHARHRVEEPEPGYRHHPRPENIHWPLTIPGVQYNPLAWTDLPGWKDDDQLAAFKAFRLSCAPVLAQPANASSDKFLGTSLREPCKIARSETIANNAEARGFFEQHFVPLQISRLGDAAGFVTGYYEPVVDGSRTRTDVFTVPLYRRPSNLFVRGYSQASDSLPNKGDVFRKIGRRKLVPYYDRAQIEDGAIAGRGLEIAWLKNQTDLLFIQIQGSARIKLQDGSVIRINYDSHNGYPYTPVGRLLIDRGIIPKEQMSMQRIREWMEQSPAAANDLRRQNRSYIFFHEVPLKADEEAVGAQGVPLTPGRSIAVDKALHVYGTPFFIDGKLPIDSDASTTPFQRLMVAQDTGSAIVGPARADLYFGAGTDAGKIAGRIKNAAQFAILLPKSLDPSARAGTIPLPDERPSAKIARLYPETKTVASAPETPAAKPEAKPDTQAMQSVPLPAARPNNAPDKASEKTSTKPGRSDTKSGGPMQPKRSERQ
ncbi:MAG: MltA domain-containing protein [Xanthobacteraceae bacterium]|nr:MltA domain-containing protein [Xanthobacteraceae bacterium]